MPGPTLTVSELAEEIGRKASYVYDNWRELAKKRVIPHPLNGGAAPLAWSRAQVYALLDRALTRDERLAAQSYRAAAAAAANVRHTNAGELEDAEWGSKLDARFANKGAEA